MEKLNELWDKSLKKAENYWFDSSQIKLNEAYLESYVDDGFSFLARPLDWDKWDYLQIAGLGSAGYLIALNDGYIRHIVLKNRNSFTQKMTTFALEPWGSGKYSLPLVGGFWVGGLLTDNLKTQQTGLLGLKAYVLSQVFIIPAKFIFHRQRPCQVKYGVSDDNCPSIYNFKGPFTKHTNYKSFPSNHTFSAFSVATVIASEYPGWPAYTAYSVAALTGLSRMEANKHWASDVFTGAVWGYFLGKFIVLTHPLPNNNAQVSTSDNNTFSVSQSEIRPYLWGDASGAEIIFSFKY